MELWRQPAAGGNFLGLGTPVVQFTLIFAIQMWTFPQKSDFFQIRNTGNFSVLGKSTFSKSEIPEIFQKIAGNYRQKKTLEPYSCRKRFITFNRTPKRKLTASKMDQYVLKVLPIWRGIERNRLDSWIRALKPSWIWLGFHRNRHPDIAIYVDIDINQFMSIST